MNWGMNNTVPEPNRSMEELGFMGLTKQGAHPDEAFPAGTSTNPQFRLGDEILDSSNTATKPMPDPAGGNYGLRRY